MRGIHFKQPKPADTEARNRMDIACFVGFIDLAPDPERSDIDDWLQLNSWMLDADSQVNTSVDYIAAYHRESAAELLDVPVPVESWEKFTRLFAWNDRDYGDGLRGMAFLAAAVRSFFAQGGRKCYVVRVASPPAIRQSFLQRLEFIDLLVPGFDGGQISSIASDRTSWRGVGHLLGLPEVSILCVPDLPALLKREEPQLPVEVPVETPGTERFVECSDPLPPLPPDNPVDQLSAPRCDETGYRKWADVIRQIAEFISRNRRDVQLVTAIPLPREEIKNLFRLFHDEGFLSGSLVNANSLASSFVQLVYPWLQTSHSGLLPQGLEPPDGALAGMLAANAISRGAFRSLTGQRQKDITGLHPRLGREAMNATYSKEAVKPSLQSGMIERVSLFGDSIKGVTLLSDVTTSNNRTHRQANVNRIISMLFRATRQLGEELVFEDNGEALWAEITQRLNNLLQALFALGALRGREPEEAFSVRCDRSTMSQQDLDSGRVIALVRFEPATSIESIEVQLDMRQNGPTSLSPVEMIRAAS